MTAHRRHWTATIEYDNGDKITMGIRAENGYVVFASSRFRFKATPDNADLISPSVQAASNAAREQRRG